jgi:hypothetical protein
MDSFINSWFIPTAILVFKQILHRQIYLDTETLRAMAS